MAYYKPNGSRLDPCGGFVRSVVELGPSGNRLVGGSAVVFATPEPGTLGLLGTGVIALADNEMQVLAPDVNRMRVTVVSTLLRMSDRCRDTNSLFHN